MVVAPDMKPVEFRLGPGHTLRGRVVDRDGKPLDGVTIQAMDWKGHMLARLENEDQRGGTLHLGFRAARAGASDAHEARLRHGRPARVSGRKG